MRATVEAASQMAIEAAMVAAGVGGEVYFPSAVYEVSALAATVPLQRWLFESGAALMNVGATQPILSVDAVGVQIVGGTFDGNGASIHAIGGAYGLDIEQATILNVANWGLRFPGGRLRVHRCRFEQIAYSAIYWQAPTAGQTAPRITENVINMAAGYVSQPAVLVRGEGEAQWCRDAVINGNDITMPDTGPTAIGIELRRCLWFDVSGNITRNGHSGISLAGSSSGQVMGNRLGNFEAYGVELAKVWNSPCVDVVVVGNVIQGQTAPSQPVAGVELNASYDNIVLGNRIKYCQNDVLQENIPAGKVNSVGPNY